MIRFRCTFCGGSASYEHPEGVTVHVLALATDPAPVCCDCFDRLSGGAVCVGDTCPNPLHGRPDGEARRTPSPARSGVVGQGRGRHRAA